MKIWKQIWEYIKMIVMVVVIVIIGSNVLVSSSIPNNKIVMLDNKYIIKENKL